jgi:hypothetical protein
MMAVKVSQAFVSDGFVSNRQWLQLKVCNHSASLPANSSRELYVLWHDGNTLGVDRTDIGILKDAYQIRLSYLLHREHRLGRESQVMLERSSNLSDQSAERHLG